MTNDFPHGGKTACITRLKTACGIAPFTAQSPAPIQALLQDKESTDHGDAI
jgi:hypothetical protein